MNLKVGVWLPSFGNPLPIRDYLLDFDDIKELAKLAEKYDFNSIWVSDHLINPAGAKLNGGPVEDRPILEAWTTLSALSTLTNKVKLGTLVICSLFRHPSLLAKMAATLDVISKGRVILNIGAGWFKREAIAYGIPWKNYSERLVILEETIKIMKRLWQNKKVNFKGKLFELKDAILEPKPIQKPHPPIWIGGKSNNILELVAKEGNGWDLDIHENVLDSIKERVTSLRRYCLILKRDPKKIEISTHSIVILKKNDEEAVKAASSYARAINKPIEEFIANYFVGSPTSVIEKLKKYVNIGVTNLCLFFVNGAEGIEIFNEEVFPCFKK